MKYSVLGVEIDQISRLVFWEKVETWLQSQTNHWLVTANPEIVLRAKDEKYRQILSSADLRLADGIGLVWAVNFLYGQKIERIIGADLTVELCQLAERKNLAVYFLGGAEGVAEVAAANLQKIYPHLRVVGASPGGVGSALFNHPEVLQQINLAQPDFLFVAFGSPSQEQWLAENINKLPSIRLAVGVGGTFDFLARLIKRAPSSWQKLGLEWLWRLMQQPWRYRRIIRAVIIFPWRVLKQKFSN
ncbi:MAG: WecB/TagA/CpsF family glycosyltransferase [Candidatus Buchananbacteria bacterium]